jgi:hypothetical protein
MRARVGWETTRFPAGELASFLRLLLPGSCLAPSPAGVSALSSQSSYFVVNGPLYWGLECLFRNPFVTGLTYKITA